MVDISCNTGFRIEEQEEKIRRKKEEEMGNKRINDRSSQQTSSSNNNLTVTFIGEMEIDLTEADDDVGIVA